MSGKASLSTSDPLLTSADLEKLVLTHDDRRSSARFSYMVPFRMSPGSSGEPPVPESFHTVMGRDISEGGISFFFASKPTFDALHIELGQGDARFCLAAQVIGSNPMVGLEPYHLVRCRFTELVGTR